MSLVLIGIPSFRRPHTLGLLLDSLEHQVGLDGHDVRLFVADSDAGHGDAIALCRARAATMRRPLSSALVAEPGISAARNRILAEARAIGADFLAMIDDDETAEPGWLAALLDVQAATGADLVGGPVVYGFDGPMPAGLAHGPFAQRRRPTGRTPSLDTTNNVLLWCPALSRIGWPSFDPAFGLTGGEDKEYFTRLAKAGLLFAWAQDAVVHERVGPERRRLGSILRRSFRIGSTDLAVARLHAPPAVARRELAKGTAALISAPLLIPLLLSPSRRLWVLRKWWRAAGKLSAAFGHRYTAYGPAVTARP